MEQFIIDTAKVMSKGQITLPKDIRERLSVSAGDRVTLICEDDRVVLMNSAIFAMKVLQKGMAGAFENAGIENDEDIMDLVKDVRSEIEHP